MFMCNFDSIPCQLNSTTARLLVFMTERNRRSKNFKLLVYDELNDQRERGIRHFSNPTLRAILRLAILMSHHFEKLYL